MKGSKEAADTVLCVLGKRGLQFCCWEDLCAHKAEVLHRVKIDPLGSDGSVVAVPVAWAILLVLKSLSYISSICLLA